MAEIVLGLATSHGPMLSTPPEQWGLRVAADRTNPAHWFRGRQYGFADLARLRAGENLHEQTTGQVWAERHAACRRAIAQLADLYQAAQADLVIVFGNDQMELFGDDNMPALAAYLGEHIENQRYDEEVIRKMPPGIGVSVDGHIPPQGATYPGAPEIGRHLIRQLIAEGFDIAALKGFPEGKHTVPHAFGFIYRQLMQDRPVPSLPLFLNTFYPPNQPSARRCADFGRAVARAVQAWPGEERVVLVASGGLSHFVIDEELDQVMLDAIRTGDMRELESLNEWLLQSGSSEIKNWIPLAAAMSELGWPGTVIDYMPCYRSEAGTGNAMGFACWQPPGT